MAFQGGLHASTCCCYKWCQFQSNWKCPSKMKIQDSTIYPSPTLCIKPQALHMITYKGYSSGNPTSTRGTTSSGSHWSSHGPFYGHWWQRGRGMNKDMNYPWMTKGEMKWNGHGSRGAILRRINTLGQKEHTSRGSKLMNLVVCIWYVHIHCISFKIYICIACVWCMLVIEDWWFDN